MYIAKRNGRRLSFDDRALLEALYKKRLPLSEIARRLGVHPSTVSREVRRGLVQQRDSRTWKMYTVYSADVAQQKADFQQTAKGRPEKIGKRYDYLSALEKWVLDGYSPAAAIAAVAKSGNFDIRISKGTFYKYLALGYFSRITYSDLPEGKRKTKRGKVKRRRTANPLHRSIEHRSPEIMKRSEFGHWELDSVIGKSQGKRQSCLVLTERKTRLEIILKVTDKTAKSTVRAMQYLRGYFGCDFKLLFKTITCDNGSEFADQNGMEQTGTTVFYCHPSCPHERGSNECANRLVRRKLRKGQSMAKVFTKEARNVQNWVNNYPRPMFEYRSSLEMFREELPRLQLSRPEKTLQFFE